MKEMNTDWYGTFLQSKHPKYEALERHEAVFLNCETYTTQQCCF